METSSNTPSPTPAPTDVIGGNPPSVEPSKVEPAPAAPEPLTWDSLGDALPADLDREHPLSIEFLDLMNNQTLSPKERMTKLLDLQSRANAEASGRGSESFENTVNEWRKSLNTDAEIGGPKLTASLAEANRIVNQYGTPELKQMLVTTGVANHPEFARLLVRLAPMVTEPKPLNGTTPAVGPKYTTSNLYPDQPGA